MSNYYRITCYWPKEDLSVIVDSNGMFDKLWKFSSHVVSLGFKVIEVSNGDTFLDGNIDRAEVNKERMFLRSYHAGKPVYTPYVVDGKTYKAVQVDDLVYVPDKNQ